jgi:KaiC/GvpD/RAD55 family RecA-like ATPase
MLPPPEIEINRGHEVGFYSDDRSLLDHLTQFVGSALKAGNAAIVVATESHRDNLFPELQACGLDIGAAVEQGRYIAVDAADTLSAIMFNGMPDPDRFMKAFGSLVLRAANAAKGGHSHVAVFGECVHLLWTQGNAEAAIRMEKLCNQLIKTYNVNILCGYSVSGGKLYSPIFQQILAEHSAAHFR